MTGPNWPRKRYELMVKKGTAPLGLKLHQTKTKRGGCGFPVSNPAQHYTTIIR